MGKRFMLPGAIGYDPLQQGDLDDLCGLYAAINAIYIVLAPVRPLSDRDVRRLIKGGARYLDEEKGFRNAFTKGMTAKRHRKLTMHLVTTAASQTGVRLTLRRAHPKLIDLDQGLLIQSIEDSLIKASAVIIGLHNTHDHFTVVVGASPTRFYLADSDGLNWLPKHCIGPFGGTDRYRHGVLRREIMEIGIAL